MKTGKEVYNDFTELTEEEQKEFYRLFVTHIETELNGYFNEIRRNI